MARLVVTGGTPLRGEVEVQGAKNSALPLLAATLLTKGTTILHNCPRLSDVENALRILRHLGCHVVWEEHTVSVDASNMDKWSIPDDLMREMRSSVIFLGAILARMRRAELYLPGGCELGPRPIDLHLSAFRRMGVLVEDGGGRILCDAKDMQAQDIHLTFPSVGATENIMLAACGAKETMRIHNAAREPEIVDLQNYLRSLGYCISGAGGSVITICGGDLSDRNVSHCVIPDRIVAGTYLCAAALTGGTVTLTKTDPTHYLPLCECCREMGCTLTYGPDRVALSSPGRCRPISPVQTMPYPGFPTDLQSPLMAAACFLDGASVFAEHIFQSRYRHVPELRRMGARIELIGRVAVVYGGIPLHGAELYAGDLRGGAALVIAALGAEGESTIYDIHHIDRGYEALETVFAALGGNIRRI